jgi:hypothetical protein
MKTLKMNNEGSKKDIYFDIAFYQMMETLERFEKRASKKETTGEKTETKPKKVTKKESSK